MFVISRSTLPNRCIANPEVPTIELKIGERSPTRNYVQCGEDGEEIWRLGVARKLSAEYICNFTASVQRGS
jgi:hypothetical protein